MRPLSFRRCRLRRCLRSRNLRRRALLGRFDTLLHATPRLCNRLRHLLLQFLNLSSMPTLQLINTGKFRTGGRSLSLGLFLCLCER